jgi:hypothetical protein
MRVLVQYLIQAPHCPLTPPLGTDIYAYGLSGPSQSSYIAQLDNTTIGTYTARTADTEYHHLLFSAHDLQDGVTHELTLVNAQDGASMAFDYAVVTSMAAFERCVRRRGVAWRGVAWRGVAWRCVALRCAALISCLVFLMPPSGCNAIDYTCRPTVLLTPDGLVQRSSHSLTDDPRRSR